MTTTGRPTVLDPTKKEVIYALLQVGVSQRRAAAVIGVSEAVLRYWIRNDADFAQRVTQAEALLEVELLLNLTQAAGSSWRAAALALKHLVPDRFGEKKLSLVDPEREAEREFHELQVQREIEEMAAAEQGNEPPPHPAPDPDEPSTVATRQFAERLTKTIADASAADASRSGQAANDETNDNKAHPRRPDKDSPHHHHHHHDTETEPNPLRELARQLRSSHEPIGPSRNGHSKRPRDDE